MNTSRKIVILGSSGSIGQTALKLLSSGRTGLEVVGLAVRRDTESLLRDAARFNVRHIAVADRERRSRGVADLYITFVIRRSRSYTLSRSACISASVTLFL